MRRLLLTALGLWTLSVARVFAQPTVHVRAESRIELSVARVSGGIAIDAVLRDDLGTPLADRELVIRLSPRAHDAIPNSMRRRSDADGHARAQFALPTGDYEIGATFAGDDDHDRADVARPLDLTRADVHLRMRVPNDGRFSREDPNPVVVNVDAESIEGGSGLTVQLTDELGRPLAHGVTDSHGHAEFRLLVIELGPASAGRLVARSSADTRRAEAQTEVPILRVTATHVSIRTSTPSARPGDTVHLSGELRDGRNVALPRQAIGIFSGERNVASALTDESGRFNVELTLEGVEDDVSLVARFDSDAPWRVSSVSPPITIVVRSLSLTPFVWALLTTLLTGIAVWLVARRTRPPTRVSTNTVVAKSAGVERGERVSIRIERFDISGVVLDTFDVALEGASVELVGSDGTATTLRTDERGRFAASTIAPGTHVMTVRAPGYSSLSVEIAFPHRGDWAQMRVRLLNLRKKALDAIHPVAAEVLPRGPWGVSTAREVLDAARQKGPMPHALPMLAESAELAGYAKEPPDEGAVREVEKARDATLEEFRARKAPEDP